MDFSPDGRLLAVGDGRHHLTLWHLPTRQKLATLDHWGDVYAVAFSPDGQTLASGSRGRVAQFWNVSRWVKGGPELPEK